MSLMREIFCKESAQGHIYQQQNAPTENDSLRIQVLLVICLCVSDIKLKVLTLLS